MLYRTLGKTGYQVSGVVYAGIVSMDVGQAVSDREVAWAVDQGINYFDVAPSYNDAEQRLGPSLKPYRKNVYLACKTLERKREGTAKEIRRSMELLHTDWFDNYQLHAVTSPRDVEEAFGPGGAMELLRDLKEQGVVRKLGITAHSEQAALKCLELYDFDTVMFPTSYLLHMGQGIGRDLQAHKAGRGFGLLGMKSLIERAWKDDADHKAAGFPKSWCKPFAPEEVDLRLAAMKYALSMGADVLVPPGNEECFRFMVQHAQQALTEPLTGAEMQALKARFEQVKAWPFFDKNNGNWEENP